MLLTWRVARIVIIEFALPSILGLILFWLCGRFLFQINLWRAASQLRILPIPLVWWGIITCLSILVGSWSVGGAVWHLLASSLRWTLLFGSGDE